MIKLFLSTAICAFAFSAIADVETNFSGAKIPQLSDAEIVQIMLNLNSSEVASSEIALQQATRPDVKNFAAQLIETHRMNTIEAQRLAIKYNIRALPSSTSRDLQEMSKTVRRNLINSEGPTLDRAYVEHQVVMQASALKMLNDKLIPRARSVALKSYLEETREVVITHLGDARKLLDELDVNFTD